ncbi:E3 ubiquitin-protein ligase rnf168-like [Argopecten irradians]|uniref:E3 ubiquitin-protein ligase rnf168-like n=1 Tax=Argopecten irradians TaxID=31199 RepID=UPI00371B50B9
MMGKLAVEDCMCPICMSILIEPVTMPCSHTLCMPCFKQNVEEASLSCPLCRTRISVWARRATKNGNLVNEKLWNTIKTSYRDKVDKRLAGDDDDDNGVYLPIIQLSDPGEIRKEYEAEMEKLSKQREVERQKEIEASEALIKKLQEEEMGLLERRKKTEQEDEKLAKELTDVMEEAGTDAPINFLMAESQSRLTRSTSVVTCSSGTSGRSSSLRPASTIESFISKMREAEKLKEADRISSASSMPFLNSTPDRNLSEQSGKFLKVEKVKDPDSKSSGCSLPYMCNNQEKSDCSSNISVKSKSRASSWNYGMVDMHTENEGLFSDELSQDLSKRSSSCASDGLICMGPESSGGSRSVILSPDIEVISDKPKNSSPSIFKNERASSKASRASSVQSLDSITQELNHFKPINVCPVTPPRKLASGKVVEPSLIRTTPRNLYKTSFSSPTNNELSLSDLDACSPIMQRRLSELEEERKSNVRRLSKSTLTLKKNDEDERNENQSAMDRLDKNNSSKVEQTYKGSKGKDMMDKGNIKMSSNEVCVAKKLMIPLESNIDDSMDFDIPPPLCENNNIINVDSDSRSSSGSALLRKKRACALKQEDLQSQNLCKKEISEEKHRLETFSPQRSITDWIVKGGKSCRDSGQSPGFFTLQETCLGRDEVDGDLGRKVGSKKSKIRTIDHFMSKVEKDCNKSRTVSSKRKKKTTQNKDYIWPDYSPKKREKVSTNMETSYGSDLVEKEDEGNSEAPVGRGKKRCISDAESEKTKLKRRKITEVSKGNTTKSLKHLKKSRLTVKSSKSKSRTLQDYELATSDICDTSDSKYPDLTETSISEPADANVFDEDDWRKRQEKVDELYAIKLAKEFEMEARLRLTSCRFKGSDNEYKLRRHPPSRRNTCSDM